MQVYCRASLPACFFLRLACNTFSLRESCVGSGYDQFSGRACSVFYDTNKLLGLICVYSCLTAPINIVIFSWGFFIL